MMEVWSRPPGGRKAASAADERSEEGSSERTEKLTEERSNERSERRAEKRPEERSRREHSAAGEEDMCFVYPVLQPAPRAPEEALPWSGAASKGYLRFSVFFANPFNRSVGLGVESMCVVVVVGGGGGGGGGLGVQVLAAVGGTLTLTHCRSLARFHASV